MTLSTNLSMVLKFTEQKTVGGITVDNDPRFVADDGMSDGVTIDKNDVLYAEKAKAITASQTISLDLAGGVTDVYGNTLTFVKVKGVYIKNLSTTAGDSLKIGGNANAFKLFDNATDIYEIGPNGIFFVWEPSLAGRAVTASTGDILDIVEQAGNANTFDIAIWGTTS